MSAVVINLYGQPGAGKSTLAAYTFARLKQKRPDLNTELVTEFAKSLTWADRKEDLKCQPYIFGKQLNRMWHLRDKVNIIITDSPLMLSLLYTDNSWGTAYRDAVYQISRKFNNLDFFLQRIKAYNPIGRNQSEEESDKISDNIKLMFYKYNMKPLEIDGDIKSSDKILSIVNRYFV